VVRTEDVLMANPATGLFEGRARQGRFVRRSTALAVLALVAVLVPTLASGPAHATTGRRGVAYVANRDDNTISVLDTTTNAVVDTFAVGVQPFGVAVNPAGTRLVVSNSGAGTVSVIDPVTGSAVGTPTVGGSPRGVALNPTGTTAYVANSSGLVSVIDVISGALTTQIATGSPSEGLAVTSDGSRVYVPSTTTGTLTAIGTATGTVVATIDGLGDGSSQVALSSDDAFAYVTNEGSDTLSVIDTAEGAVITNVTVGDAPIGVATGLYGVDVVNSGSDTVSVVDPASYGVSTVAVGTHPVGIARSPDGWTYVANQGSNDLTVLDAVNRVTGTVIPVGAGPQLLAVGPPPARRTNVLLRSSLNPAGAGQTVTYRASAAPFPPGSRLTGTMAFDDGGAPIPGCAAVPFAGDPVNCSVTYSTAAGSPHSITATYSGDDANLPSSDTLSQTVYDTPPTPMATTVSLSSSHPSVQAGASLSYSATIAANPPGRYGISGTVTFNDGGTPIPGCTVPLSYNFARCTLTYASSAGSPHAITADYSGSEAFLPSSASLTQVVRDAPSSSVSSVSVVGSPNPAQIGQPITYTATVVADPYHPHLDFGQLQFTDDGHIIPGCYLVQIQLGVGSCTVTYPSVAGSPHLIVAAYNGTPGIDPSSGSLSEVVNEAGAADTSVAVGSSVNPSVAGQTVTYTAAVSSDSPGAITGTVTFDDGGTAIPGCVDVALASASGTCDVTYAGTAGSPHSITATYSGAAAFLASSATLSQVVNKAPTTLVAAPGTGDIVNRTYSATLTRVFDGAPIAGAPVTFSYAGKVLCTATTNASGVAACSVRALSFAGGTYTAAYAGDADHLASTGSNTRPGIYSVLRHLFGL
jgi:YVTN family beta-propeller protein